MITGMPVKVDIDREELVAPLSKTAVIIAEKIKEMLVNTPPELIGDIHNDGIILTGGLAGVRGIDNSRFESACSGRARTLCSKGKRYGFIIHERKKVKDKSDNFN